MQNHSAPSPWRTTIHRARRTLSLAALALGAFLFATTANAQDASWPKRPVTLIAPFAPGGSTDMLARVIAQALTKELKQQVIVENRGGAGGTLGAGIAAKAAPDGYTILLSNVTLSSADAAYRKLPYDFVTDFNHVAYLGSIPCVLVSSKTLPVTDVRQFLDYLRKHPGETNYGSSGTGAASHMCTQSFLTAGGFKATHVPYKGAGPMMIDLMSGTISFAVDTAASAAAQIRGGKVVGLAATSDQRIDLLPELPTLREAGVPFEMSIWYGLVTPRSTPADINARLNEATKKILSYPEVLEAYKKLGASVDSQSKEVFLDVVKRDKVRWTKIAKDAGIEPQ